MSLEIVIVGNTQGQTVACKTTSELKTINLLGIPICYENRRRNLQLKTIPKLKFNTVAQVPIKGLIYE